MKLLVLSPFPYHAQVRHGGGVVCYQQLKLLAQQHEVHFLSFVVRESDEEVRIAEADLAQLCASVQTLRLDLGQRALWRARRAFLSRLVPVDAGLFDEPAMQVLLQQKLATVRPDVVMLQFPQMAQYAGHCGQAATALDVQDSFSISAFRRFRAAPFSLGKLRLFVNWIAWLFYEMRHYARVDAVFTLTEQDRAGLEIFSPGLGADLVPSAVNVPDEALLGAPVHVAGAPAIGFIGSFSHYPNAEAAQYFITQVWPAIVQQHPGARLRIAGANVPPALLALAGPQIDFLGFVPDANIFMRSNDVMVVPLLSGGGIKVKTLEAMACACPMVSTSIGTEQTGALHEQHVLIADTAPAFADAVLALLADPARGRVLGERARALVGASFSWQAKVASLERVFAQALRKRAARPT